MRENVDQANSEFQGQIVTMPLNSYSAVRKQHQTAESLHSILIGAKKDSQQNMIKNKTIEVIGNKTRNFLEIRILNLFQRFKPSETGLKLGWKDFKEKWKRLLW